MEAKPKIALDKYYLCQFAFEEIVWPRTVFEGNFVTLKCFTSYTFASEVSWNFHKKIS